MSTIKSYKELDVYRRAMDVAMEIFQITKAFPSEEKYSLVDQIRRSSRSACANIAEAWRKRRYVAAFINKLSDAETEACESQVWIEFCKRCGYINERDATRLDDQYDHIMTQLIKMIENPDKWTIKKKID
jgi:four helix bundle protein